MEPLNEKLFLDRYNKGIEKNRLHKGLGLIEFARTKEILLEKLPPAPAVIYDIGGAYGEYAYWLAALGYQVFLYDLSEKNIGMAHRFGKNAGSRWRAPKWPMPEISPGRMKALTRSYCLAHCII